MRYRILSLISIVLLSSTAVAQEKWDLKKCVDYALENNISVKQNEIQARIADLNYNQNKLSAYPSVNISAGPSYSNGRNQDPTSFGLITQGFLSANMQLQSSVQIFNWYSRKNAIIASQWQAAAAKAATDKLKNDIALVVANSYLQVLLTKEQEKIAQVQLGQTNAQLSNTRKLVNAGALPELNAAELEAQAARDSSSVISAAGNVQQAVLVLMAYMNLDAAVSFDVAAPPVDFIPLEKIADLQPEAVYASALVNLPQQRVNEFNLKAAKKSAESARGSMYPVISLFGSLSSNFINAKNPVYSFTGYETNPFSPEVVVGGVAYKVGTPAYAVTGSTRTPFFTQLDNNFRQTIGLGISIPIFNGGSARTAWKRSNLNVTNIELQKLADNQKIKQDIYQAYNAAIVALEKFNASKKVVETSQRSHDFAQKRYAVGMLSTIDLITNQNNLFRAKLEYAASQFDYVFKMKVLEFYKGQGIKL